MASKNEINYSSVMSTHINYFQNENQYKSHKLKWLFCGVINYIENLKKKFEKININIRVKYKLNSYLQKHFYSHIRKI